MQTPGRWRTVASLLTFHATDCVYIYIYIYNGGGRGGEVPHTIHHRACIYIYIFSVHIYVNTNGYRYIYIHSNPSLFMFCGTFNERHTAKEQNERSPARSSIASWLFLFLHALRPEHAALNLPLHKQEAFTVAAAASLLIAPTRTQPLSCLLMSLLWQEHEQTESSNMSIVSFGSLQKRTPSKVKGTRASHHKRGVDCISCVAAHHGSASCLLMIRERSQPGA